MSLGIDAKFILNFENLVSLSTCCYNKSLVLEKKSSQTNYSILICEIGLVMKFQNNLWKDFV